MKKILIPLTIIAIAISFSYLIVDIPIYDLIYKSDYNIVNNELYYKKENTKTNYSNYLKYLDIDYVNNNEEIYSMFYTILNNGYDIYTFTCKYNCLNDIDKINSLRLSVINQLVTPNNSYKEIKTSYTTDGKITLNINKKYSKEDIDRINKEIDRLIVSLKINNYPTIEEKIRVYHDYIANRNSYDQVMADTGKSEYHSNTAIGPLFEGKAICDGYSDTMAFFLDKLGIENIKVTNDEHVWNAIKLNGTWYHIDLTWDDPIYTNGRSLTIHDYFMLTTKGLKDKKDDSHSFDEKIYDFIK